MLSKETQDPLPSYGEDHLLSLETQKKCEIGKTCFHGHEDASRNLLGRDTV